MSDYFVDTSALAKRYLPEIGTQWLRHWVRPASGNIIAVAEPVRVEMFALFSHYSRSGILDSNSLNILKSNFLRHLQAEYFVIPVDTQVLIAASTLADKYPVRPLDAIQLACASRASVLLSRSIIFVSTDANLLDAATAEGFTTDNPDLHG